MVMKMIKTYSELITIDSFIERYRYLRIGGVVGEETFGYDRWLNQLFYKDPEWLGIRDEIIIRDSGGGDYCRDLGVIGRDITGVILVHHINPITKEDILRRAKKLFDPENLIATCKSTHDAIHYGDESLLLKDPVQRRMNDTCPWRR